MLTIFKPGLRCVLAQNASGSHQGALESTEAINGQLEEFMKEAALVNSFLFKPKAAGKGKGNPGTKGAKKGSARGSKG